MRLERRAGALIAQWLPLEPKCHSGSFSCSRAVDFQCGRASKVPQLGASPPSSGDGCHQRLARDGSRSACTWAHAACRRWSIASNQDGARETGFTPEVARVRGHLGDGMDSSVVAGHDCLQQRRKVNTRAFFRQVEDRSAQLAFQRIVQFFDAALCTRHVGFCVHERHIVTLAYESHAGALVLE
jgi:hypothetical protein